MTTKELYIAETGRIQLVKPKSFDTWQSDYIKWLEKRVENQYKAIPTQQEIEAEASTYDNSMTSIAESIHVPRGFIYGAQWAFKYLTSIGDVPYLDTVKEPEIGRRYKLKYDSDRIVKCELNMEATCTSCELLPHPCKHIVCNSQVRKDRKAIQLTRL